MPTPTKGPRLGGSPAHERLMVANLATALFEHGRITTTQAKAKRLRPVAERLVTYAKKGDLAARRQALKVVRDKSVVHELFTEIGPRYANRPGGYTRTTKIGPRKGDNAPMVVIELVEPLTEQVVAEATGAAKRAAKEQQQQQAAAVAAADRDIATTAAADAAEAAEAVTAAEEGADLGAEIAAEAQELAGGAQDGATSDKE